jgi:hypothetical protein
MKYFTLRLFEKSKHNRTLLEEQSTNKPYKSVSVKLIKSIMKSIGSNYCEVYQSEHLGYAEGLPIKQIFIK